MLQCDYKIEVLSHKLLTVHVIINDFYKRKFRTIFAINTNNKKHNYVILRFIR